MINIVDPGKVAMMATGRLRFSGTSSSDAWRFADCDMQTTSLNCDSLDQGGLFYSPLHWKACTHQKVSGRVDNYPTLGASMNLFVHSLDVDSRNRESVYSDGFMRVSPSLVFAPVGVPCIYMRFSSYKGRYGPVDAVTIRFAYAWQGPQGLRCYASSLGVEVGKDLTRPWQSSKDVYALGGNYLGVPEIDQWFHRPYFIPYAGDPDVTGIAHELVSTIRERWLSGSAFGPGVTGAEGELNLLSPVSLAGVQPRYRSAREVLGFVRHAQHNCVRIAELDFARVRPQLDAQALDGIQKFDGNLGLFASKISTLGGVTIQSVVDLVRSGVSRQSLASYWLAARYGDRLGLSSLADLIHSLNRELGSRRSLKPQPQILRAGVRCQATEYFAGTAFFSRTLAVWPDDSNTFMKLTRQLMEWDAYPTLQNVWDAIPLSFVVDWFLNVGDIFQSIDRMVQSRYYSVASAIDAYKTDYCDKLIPELSFVRYERREGGGLQLGVSSVELGLPSTVNIVSGAALLCG